ncbi:23890_t:CDS:2, partial [Gigaspora rosea]
MTFNYSFFKTISYDYSEIEDVKKIGKEIALEEFGIRSFNYSQFCDLQLIGRGGSANVYSGNFQGKKFALKVLNTNLPMDDKTVKNLTRE